MLSLQEFCIQLLSKSCKIIFLIHNLEKKSTNSEFYRLTRNSFMLLVDSLYLQCVLKITSATAFLLYIYKPDFNISNNIKGEQVAQMLACSTGILLNIFKWPQTEMGIIMTIQNIFQNLTFHATAFLQSTHPAIKINVRTCCQVCTSHLNYNSLTGVSPEAITIYFQINKCTNTSTHIIPFWKTIKMC